MPEADEAKHFNVGRKDMPESWADKHIVHLVATWTHLGLELFHLDAWGTHEVHPSAAADILAGGAFP